MLNILTLEILLHERPVEDLLRDAEATYAEASNLKLQKPGDIWVWVQEGTDGSLQLMRCAWR